MIIGYATYVSREIELMTKYISEQITLLKEIGLNDNFDVILRLSLLTAIQHLKSKEFLIYFMQHQDKLVSEQNNKLTSQAK